MIKNKNIYRKEETLMAQLWGGRFTKETDQLVYNFNASISFDQKFYKQDIRGSIAHVTMLASVGVLTEEERDQIIDGLKGISKDIQTGAVEITSEYEDIHSFVEANLIDRIGDVGKKLHTGRSRNDQVALDMKLYTRDEIVDIKYLLKELMETLHRIMKEHIDTFMPGFTHLQKAQPVTLAHHVGAPTLGTMDGANVEIVDEVGAENAFIFGMSSEEVINYENNGGYHPYEIYQNDKDIHEVLDQLVDGTYANGDPELYKDLYQSLLFGDTGSQADMYFILKDFRSYAEAQKKVEEAYRDTKGWAKMAMTNTAGCGKFSSDRTIQEYVDDIWHLDKIR